MMPTSEAVSAARPPFILVVVEDDPDVRRLLGMLLARDDRLVLGSSFDNASDALAAVRSDCPDAIVCDVGLPGMSGLQALPLLRAACPDTVIVMYTGNPEGSLGALVLGADAVVGKGSDPTEVLDRILELLEQSS